MILEKSVASELHKLIFDLDFGNGDDNDKDDGDGDDDEGDMQNLRRKNKFSLMHLTDFCLSTVA